MKRQSYLPIILLIASGLSFNKQTLASLNLDQATIARLSDERSGNFADCLQHFWQGLAPTVSGIPPTTDPSQNWYTLCFSDFALLYSGVSRTALYTAHHLSADEVAAAKTLERVDSFRPEPFLPRHAQVSLEDYKGYNYDRGHLVPNGDMATLQAQYDSFSLANIIPQNSEHNRGIWRKIEQKTRSLASDFGEAYVLTGTAYHGQTVRTMNGVLVPSHLFKLVYLPRVNQAGVYYSPNDGSLTYEIIDVQELENRTGIKTTLAPHFNPSLFSPEQTINKPLLSLWVWLKMVVVNLWQGLQA